ncbi:hypothetical protein D3C84_1159130 [compost metagenome]
MFSATEAGGDYRSVLNTMFERSDGDIDAIREQFGGQLSLGADIYLESLRVSAEHSR